MDRLVIGDTQTNFCNSIFWLLGPLCLVRLVPARDCGRMRCCTMDRGPRASGKAGLATSILLELAGGHVLGELGRSVLP